MVTFATDDNNHGVVRFVATFEKAVAKREIYKDLVSAARPVC
jgi:hypothetical protein